MPDSFKWNKNSSERFIKALEAKEISNKINLFMERKFNCNETELKTRVIYLRTLCFMLLQRVL